MGTEPAVAAPVGRLPRVLIVDDSAVARAVIARAIEEVGGFELAGAVPHAAAARALLARERVEVILLDIEMPGVDGLSALPDLVSASQGARVIIVSSMCAEGAAATVQALALGAADTLVKPRPGVSHARFAELLADKLRLTASDDLPPAPATPLPPRSPLQPMGEAKRYDLIAIGASTGGIHALGQLLRAVPASITTPILITQHLPASFMPFFAAQVAVLAQRTCEVATDRLRLRPSRVVVAPGDSHVRCVALADGGLAVRLSEEPSPSGCMPSVDVMFDSIAKSGGGARALAVVLSGMGRDGAIGARALVEAGGDLVAQDRQSAVVWGMPGAVANDLAHAVMPPDEIGQLIASRRSPR